jgi:phage terminase large subunit
MMPTLADPAYTRQARAYLTLRRYWRADPVAYVRQRFGLEPTWQQEAILRAIAVPGAKVSVRSGHGIGKSACAAWILLWYLETHDYAKVPCTAPSAHQLRDVLWGELSKWRRYADAQAAARGDHPALWLSTLFHLTQDKLCEREAPEWAAIARTARKETPEALQGFHAPHLLYVIDEGSGVAEEIYEAAEGALSTPAARVLMLGNPTRTRGTFYASHNANRGDYTTLHFCSHDSPLVDPGDRQRLARKWGEGSNVVRVRADGDFPRQEDDVLISLDLTEPCLTREREDGVGQRILGIDVARMGSDRTVLLLRQGRVVEHIRIFARQDTMRTVGCILAVLDVWRVDLVAVDLIGVGSGVHARLVELTHRGRIQCQVQGVDVSRAAPPKRPEDEMQAHRFRDHLWLLMARWLREEDPVFCAEDRQACEDLAGELASVHYRLTSDGALVVEPKDDMKRRLGHSPDLADALACSFGPQAPLLKQAGVW